jgi:DNA polymerase II small subunit
MYKGTLIVNSGAWQTLTPYQTSVGISPTPGIAVIVDLATLKVFSRNFTENSD